jgi:hypothetical protein
MSLAQKFNRTFGAVYVLVGGLGFVGLFGGTASQTGSMLLGIFGVTLVHNLVHLGVGAAFLAGSSTDENARKTALAIGAVYLLVGVIGLFGIDAVNNLLFINGADNVLHFATGALALAVGSGRVAATA